MKTLVLPLALLTVFTACGSQADLDIGDETNTTGQALSDYAANWDGYAEAFTVAGDGSDRVRISIDENGEGTFRFGDQALVAPASDPNGPYPGGHWRDSHSQEWVLSGFEYPISNASVTASRLRFDITLGLFMDSWCALQPSEPVPGWACGQSTGSYSEINGEPTECMVTTNLDTKEPVDCDVFFQCQSCACDTEGCHALDHGILRFDAALTNGGDSMEGTLLMMDGARVTVRLER